MVRSQLPIPPFLLALMSMPSTTRGSLTVFQVTIFIVGAFSNASTRPAFVRSAQPPKALARSLSKGCGRQREIARIHHSRVWLFANDSVSTPSPFSTLCVLRVDSCTTHYQLQHSNRRGTSTRLGSTKGDHSRLFLSEVRAWPFSGDVTPPARVGRHAGRQKTRVVASETQQFRVTCERHD